MSMGGIGEQVSWALGKQSIRRFTVERHPESIDCDSEYGQAVQKRLLGVIAVGLNVTSKQQHHLFYGCVLGCDRSDNPCL
jgi:hypothetical protein